MRLKQLGREFRNCMSSYIASVMEGRSAFAVVEVEAARAVAHLRLRDGTWELEDVFGPENEVPPANCEELAETYLQSHGVHRRLAVNRVQKWACLRRMAGHVDYHVYDP